MVLFQKEVPEKQGNSKIEVFLKVGFAKKFFQKKFVINHNGLLFF